MMVDNIKEVKDLLEFAQEKVGDELLDLHISKQELDTNIILLYEQLNKILESVDNIFEGERKNKNATNKRKKSRKT